MTMFIIYTFCRLDKNIRLKIAHKGLPINLDLKIKRSFIINDFYIHNIPILGWGSKNKFIKPQFKT